MPSQNNNYSSKKKSETKARVEEIAETLLSLLPKGEEVNLDTIENTLTPILNAIRKRATERHFEEQESSEYHCPVCRQKTRYKYQRTRKIIGLTEYEINRRVFHCQQCKAYYYPLDERLGLTGRFSFEVRKAALLLGQRIPFQEASDYLCRLLGVNVSDQSILTLVESVGEKVHLEDLRLVRKTLNKEGFVKLETNDAPSKEGVAYLQMDGMMVQTREDGWKEIRNGILFSEDQRIEVDKHHHWIQNKTCFSVFNRHKNSLEAFKRRATTESCRFGFERYEKSVIIGDGAKWIWDYADTYHPNAIQILDYYHASEYLGKALSSINAAKREKMKLFKKLDAGEVIRIIEYLKKQTKTKEVVDCKRYFTNHQNRMNYAEYVKQGLAIGSGAIESTHRTLIQSRMKQAGMHWKKKNVQSIASVKARYESGRWDEMVNKHLKAA